MLRHDPRRLDPKRRHVDHRKTHFATPQYKNDYPHRLNFYSVPPTGDIKLEQFEKWAIDRLRVLAELEACSFRNRGPAETASHMKYILGKYLPLESNTAASSQRHEQRKKDHSSHFILRLAFAATEDLRRRYARLEAQLFRLRFADEDPRERAAFLASLELAGWERVPEPEKAQLAAELAATSGARKPAAAAADDDDGWFRVDWGRVPDLVEQRRVYLRHGKAYVPSREQASMVVAEFTARLERQLQLTARALPRLDEDDRITPILNHLAKNFVTPDAAYVSGDSPAGGEVRAGNVDALAAAHFPACMRHLHRALRRDAHLKHYGRLQYTLFLKSIGLSLDEALVFWRAAFHTHGDDAFNRDYRYNVQHAYGDVGGDVNRRRGGYSPFSCQKILTEHPPGPADAHGCPYRHFAADNLVELLRAMGVADAAVLRGVREDKEKQRFHVACNRVFDHLHQAELRRAKDEGAMTATQLETIVHPNEYFKRSYLLKNLGRETAEKADVKMEG